MCPEPALLVAYLDGTLFHRDAHAVDDHKPAAGGIVLRGRNANRRFMWRARDLAIEHSTDGGATWVTEHTADRPICGGAFVNANVFFSTENGGVTWSSP